MQAVLFDWDGTLADSLESFYRANVEVMAHFGLPFDRQVYRDRYTPDWREFYVRLGISPDRLDEANDRWQAAFVAADRPIDGAREALAALAASGRRLGLVTATGRAIVEPQVARFGMADLLEVLICGDEAGPLKPDPAGLREAMSRLGVQRPRDAVYVGDAPDDMRMARAAGTMAIAVPSMLGDETTLRAAGADEVHASVGAWVERLLGRPIAAA